MITHPETVPTLTAVHESVHVVCCNPDLGMCGTPVPGDDWVVPTTPVDCKLCAIAEDENLPCGDPECPRWSE